MTLRAWKTTMSQMRQLKIVDKLVIRVKRAKMLHSTLSSAQSTTGKVRKRTTLFNGKLTQTWVLVRACLGKAGVSGTAS